MILCLSLRWFIYFFVLFFNSQKYEVEFLLQQQWYDPRLRYANQSHYEYLNAIHHHEDIWLPDTYFIMHGDFKDPLIPMHFALRIYRNGTINYLMRFVVDFVISVCVCVTHTISFMFMCGSWFSFDSRHRQLSWFQITIARLWISFVFVFCVVQCPCYTALAFAVFSLEIRQLMCLINNDYTIF